MAQTTTTTIRIELVHETCFKCGVSFGLERSRYDRAQKYGETFYCTNGHGQVYATTELDRERQRREEAERARDFHASQAQYARQRAEHEARRAAAYKGVATKVKNRIENGVCPHCQRSFPNVRAHMQSKHPDEIGTEVKE